MATPTNIVKFLIRRGSNADRRQTVLAQGELGVTTDNQSVRLFVGDGTALGGIPVASKLYFIQGFSDPNLQYVETNDIVFNISNSHLYALTGTSGGSSLSSNFAYIGR